MPTSQARMTCFVPEKWGRERDGTGGAKIRGTEAAAPYHIQCRDCACERVRAGRLTDGEGEGVVSVAAAVELGAVEQRADVVAGHPAAVDGALALALLEDLLRDAAVEHAHDRAPRSVDARRRKLVVRIVRALRLKVVSILALGL